MINQNNFKERVIKLDELYSLKKMNLTLKGIKCNDLELYEYLKLNYDMPITQSYYNILHNISKPPVCLNCGCQVKFISIKRGYMKFCSNKCISSSDYIKEKKKKTYLSHYGVENPYQSEKIKEKIKETHLSNYGVKYPQQLKEIKEKIKNTCLKRYGVIAPMQINEVKNKSIYTCIKKYGVEHISQSEKIKEKIKETNIKKYGVEYYTQTKEFRKIIKNNHDKIQAKRKSTCILKYGVDNPLKNNIVRNKIYNTMKINKTFNSSTTEKISYLYLSLSYPDTKCQIKYSDKRNYIADFYIPCLDLYIECDYHWTHGKHRFNPNNKEDIHKVDLWKSKQTKYYDNAIKCWTKTDIEKDKFIHNEGYKCLHFYSLEELINWLK